MCIITDSNCHKHAAIPIDFNAQYYQKKRQPENDDRLKVLLGDNGIFFTSNIHPHVSIIPNTMPALISDILRIHDYEYISCISGVCMRVPSHPSVLPLKFGILFTQILIPI